MGGLISIGWIIWSGYARIKDMQPACYVDDTYHIVISNPESQPVFIRGINIKGNNIRSITKEDTGAWIYTECPGCCLLVNFSIPPAGNGSSRLTRLWAILFTYAGSRARKVMQSASLYCLSSQFLLKDACHRLIPNIIAVQLALIAAQKALMLSVAI